MVLLIGRPSGLVPFNETLFSFDPSVALPLTFASTHMLKGLLIVFPTKSVKLQIAVVSLTHEQFIPLVIPLAFRHLNPGGKVSVTVPFVIVALP